MSERWPETLRSPAELRRLYGTLERDAFGPGTRRDCLIIDTREDASAWEFTVDETLAGWISSLPCPVIGFSSQNGPIVPFCDVFVTTAAELSWIRTTLIRAPVASMTLVQLLRLVEQLPIQHALVAESLAYATLQGGREFREYRRPGVAPPAGSGPAVLVNREGTRLALSLNRPDNHNALSVEMRDALVEALELAGIDDSITAITLDGRGRCFSTGGDLSEFGGAPDTATAHWVRSVRMPGYFAWRCAPKLSVHLHGACIGSGLEIPAFANRVSAARNTFFQLPEVRMGLIPGAGGCVSVTRRIGRQRAAYMALSARRFNAQTALSWGLIDSIVD